MPTPGLLANAIAEANGARSRVLINASAFDIFSGCLGDQVDAQQFIRDDGPAIGSVDFIAGDFSIGVRRDPSIKDVRPELSRLRKNWVDILLASRRLGSSGMGLFLVEPAFRSKEWRRFTEALSRDGVHFSGAFRFPEQLLPDTTIEPCFALLSRTRRDMLFVADITSRSSLEDVADALVNQRFSQAVSDGVAVPVSEFRGFRQLLVEREIEALETQYKTYGHVHLVPDLAEDDGVTLVRPGENFSEEPNAVYIPRVGASPVVHRLQDAKLKHHNYIQVRLRPGIVNEYLAIYFSSKLGRLSLQASQQEGIISHLSAASLQDLPIPLPDIAQQRTIVSAHSTLMELERALAGFRTQLSLSPSSANAIRDSVVAMLQKVKRLSEAEAILAMVRQGESSTVEFKQTLTLDVRRGTKERYIELEVLKTVAAFLNSRGGTLLVGVTDEKEVVGVTLEMQKFFRGNRDEFLKHLKNLVKRSIGEQFYPYVDYDMVTIGDAVVVRVECEAADAPCFLDRNDFYVRTNPATDKLDGEKMLSYVRNRFKQ